MGKLRKRKKIVKGKRKIKEDWRRRGRGRVLGREKEGKI